MVCLVAVAFLLLFQTVDHSAEGIKALDAQQYPAAIEHFQKAIEADPKDYAAHFNLAFAYTMEKRDVEAITHYKKVLELKAGLYAAELNLGIVEVREKQFADAVTHLRAAVKEKPKEFRALYYLGEALFGIDQVAEAEDRYREAVGVDPRSAPAYVGLARAEARQNRLEEAAADYAKAAEADPAFRDALLELASQYEAAQQPRKAIEIYQKFPDNPAARERLGELLVKVGDNAAAIPNLEKAVQDSPTSANKLALAQAYLKTNETAKGTKLLGEVVAAEPTDYDLRMLYGRTLRDQRNFQAAGAEFLQAAKLKSDSAEAFSEVAVVAILLDAYPTALQALDRVRVLGGEKPGHIYFRAVVLDRMKQYKPALESYEQFLAKSDGKSPNEEFKARQRIKVIHKELDRR